LPWASSVHSYRLRWFYESSPFWRSNDSPFVPHLPFGDQTPAPYLSVSFRHLITDCRSFAFVVNPLARAAFWYNLLIARVPVHISGQLGRDAQWRRRQSAITGASSRLDAQPLKHSVPPWWYWGSGAGFRRRSLFSKNVALSPGRQSLLRLSPVRFGSQFADFSVPASWLFCRSLGSRRQLREAREREFEGLPLVTPNTRHAPGFLPRGSVLCSCPPAFRLVDL
jgi:hypothetical protein